MKSESLDSNLFSRPLRLYKQLLVPYFAYILLQRCLIIPISCIAVRSTYHRYWFIVVIKLCQCLLLLPQSHSSVNYGRVNIISKNWKILPLSCASLVDCKLFHFLQQQNKNNYQTRSCRAPESMCSQGKLARKQNGCNC